MLLQVKRPDSQQRDAGVCIWMFHFEGKQLSPV